MIAINSAISSEHLYWTDGPNERAFSSKENKAVAHFADEYNGSIKKEVGLYGIYCALEGKDRVQEKENGWHISPLEFEHLTPLALLYAMYAYITDANLGLQRSLVQGLEQMHRAEAQLENERLNLYEQQVQKFLEAQKEARKGDIAAIVFDLIIGVVEIGVGLGQLSFGIATGNAFKIASGVFLLTSGLLGCGNALLETIAFCSDDPSSADQLKEYSGFVRSVQIGCALIGFAIDGMGAVCEWLQGSRMAGGRAVVRIRETDFARLNATLQRLARSTLPANLTERFLKLLSESIQHLYIITNVIHHVLQALRKIVSGVIGREISRSEAQGKKLQAQGEFLKTLTSIQRDMINWLLKQERGMATRIANDQATLLQSSRMLNRSSLRVVNALAQAA